MCACGPVPCCWQARPPSTWLASGERQPEEKDRSEALGDVCSPGTLPGGGAAAGGLPGRCSPRPSLSLQVHRVDQSKGSSVQAWNEAIGLRVCNNILKMSVGPESPNWLNAWQILRSRVKRIHVYIHAHERGNRSCVRTRHNRRSLQRRCTLQHQCTLDIQKLLSCVRGDMHSTAAPY